MATHSGFPDSDPASTLTRGTTMDFQGMDSDTARLRDTLNTKGLTDNDTEATGLLGPDGGYEARKDSWAAMKDFEGLPWWRIPAVCSKLSTIALMSC